MNLSEALAIGGETAVIGMGIVFGVLIILLIVLQLFKVIFYKDPAKANKAQTAVPEKVVTPAPAEITTEPDEEEDDEQLIAVITAAIAASLNTSTYNLNIKSIRRVSPGRPAWNRAGLNETINNRF